MWQCLWETVRMQKQHRGTLGGGPRGPRASERKRRPQKLDWRTRQLRTDGQMPESGPSMNASTEGSEAGITVREQRWRTRYGFSAGHTKTGRSTESLSLEKLLFLRWQLWPPRMGTQSEPKKNSKNGLRTRKRTNTHKQTPAAKWLPRRFPATAGCGVAR